MQEEDRGTDGVICDVPIVNLKSRAVEEESAEERSGRDRHAVEIHSRESGWVGVDRGVRVDGAIECFCRCGRELCVWRDVWEKRGREDREWESRRGRCVFLVNDGVKIRRGGADVDC